MSVISRIAIHLALDPKVLKVLKVPKVPNFFWGV